MKDHTGEVQIQTTAYVLRLFCLDENEFLSKVLNCSTVSRNATNQHLMLPFPHQHHFIMGSLTV